MSRARVSLAASGRWRVRGASPAMGRAPTPRPRIMKLRHARVCAPQSSLGSRAHLPCGAPPGGVCGRRPVPDCSCFAALPVLPVFARLCPRIVACFRAPGAGPLDTIETSATSVCAGPGFVGVCSPRPPPRGSRRPPPTLFAGGRAGLFAARVSGPAGPRPSHRSVLPAGPSPSFGAAVRRFGARVRALAGPTLGGRQKDTRYR